MKRLFLILTISSICLISNATEVKLQTQDSLQPDRVPIYKGCEKYKSNKKLRKCLSRKIMKFINKNYNADLAYDAYLPEGKYTIKAFFKINKLGKTESAFGYSNYYFLNDEAKAVRVIKLIPKIQPATKNGHPVTVPYSIPIYVTIHKQKSLPK